MAEVLARAEVQDQRLAHQLVPGELLVTSTFELLRGHPDGDEEA